MSKEKRGEKRMKEEDILLKKGKFLQSSRRLL